MSEFPGTGGIYGDAVDERVSNHDAKIYGRDVTIKDNRLPTIVLE